MKYYQVIPLAKISLRAKPFFTYHSRLKNLENGLVEIAFGKRKIRGIVTEEAEKPPFPTREIGRIIEKNSITKNQLLLARKISQYYLTSLGIVLKFFVPPKTKKSLPIKNSRKNKTKAPSLTKEQSSSYEKIVSSKNKEFLLYGPASSGKTEVIMSLIGNTIKSKKQSLVVIPEIFLSYQEIRRYQERFGGKRVALLHSGIKKSELTGIWKSCKEGKLDILISTKIGLLFPFKNLGFIAVDEEQDISHKQWDLSPHYHSRQVASFLSDIWNARLVYASATPSLEIIDKFSKNSRKDSFIKLPMLNKKGLEVRKPKIEISDLRKYFFQKKPGQIFFKEAIDNIKEKLNQKKLVFILIPRRGKSRITICADCKKILSCPNCQLPLVQIGDYYRCLHCNFKQSTFTSCPACKSFRLKNIGVGTEKAVSDLKTIFPKARIRQADQTIFAKNSQRERLLKEIMEGKIDILVGTQSIIKGFDFKELDLAIVANAESWSGKTDYKFDEKWLGNIFQLAGRVNRPGSSQKGKIIIQTYQKENPLISFIAGWNWLDFAKKELPERKSLKYPPYSRLIKLTYKDTSLEKVEKYAKNIHMEGLKAGLDVSAPYWGYNERIRGKYEKHLLLKTKESEMKVIKNLTENLRDNWIIDVDPENIF